MGGKQREGTTRLLLARRHAPRPDSDQGPPRRLAASHRVTQRLRERAARPGKTGVVADAFHGDSPRAV